ncbi:MAG: putative Ig domain-containing protein, partial [Gammaproteobacteria bacterium]|nr:putative Ig domain-containing protein [Gammaproteobacteria bacterium]
TDGTDVASLPGFSVDVLQAPVVNTPPVISGSPAGSVFTNSGYVFQPAATDADGDNLTFSVVNKPSWASFNTANGVLSGTPSDAQAGTYSNIVISVTDGTDVASLPGFSIEAVQAPVVNTPPVISGSPAGSVFTNSGYVFQPAATDADGDNLTFSVMNKPSWASFNTANGVLSGTPSASQAGTYSNIVISVTDGTDVASLPGFSIQVNASLGSISLAWTAPAMRADGSSLSLADIDAYRVYYGPAQGNYTNSVTINDGSATSAVINNIQTGTWYVVMTTIDVNGLESGQSAAISKVAN